jgi:hypothetical protein
VGLLSLNKYPRCNKERSKTRRSALIHHKSKLECKVEQEYKFRHSVKGVDMKVVVFPNNMNVSMNYICEFAISTSKSYGKIISTTTEGTEEDGSNISQSKQNRKVHATENVNKGENAGDQELLVLCEEHFVCARNFVNLLNCIQLFSIAMGRNT